MWFTSPPSAADRMKLSPASAALLSSSIEPVVKRFTNSSSPVAGIGSGVRFVAVLWNASASPSELIDGSLDPLLPNLPSAVRLPTRNDVGAEAGAPGVPGAVVTARTACGTGSPVIVASREAKATSTQVPVGCRIAGQGVPIGPAGTTRRSG